MEGPRAPESVEFDGVVQFLNEHLRSGLEWSIADEYPTTVNRQNLQNFRIITDNNRIVSHAVLKPTLVKTLRGIFKIGCLGSVVTAEDHRNQGLSQTIIRDCLKSATDQGCDIALLWTDLYDFYRKLGFELAGSEVSLVIDRPLLSDAKGGAPFKIIEGVKVDPQALSRLYNQHTVGSLRTSEDFLQYLKIPNSRLFTAWHPETSRMEGYIVEGKGADLQGYIHEWGGSVDALVALTNHVHEKIKTPVTLIAPQHSENLIKQFTNRGAKRVDGFLGMIKLINPQNLFNKVIRHARQDWGLDDFILEQKDGTYYFGIGKDIFKTDSESDIVRLLFGPQKPNQLFKAEKSVCETLEKIFPLEMWIWGWDSV